MFGWLCSKKPPPKVAVPPPATASASPARVPAVPTTHIVVERRYEPAPVVVVDDGADDFVACMVIGEMIQSAVDLAVDVVSSSDSFDPGGGSFRGGGSDGGW